MTAAELERKWDLGRIENWVAAKFTRDGLNGFAPLPVPQVRTPGLDPRAALAVSWIAAFLQGVAGLEVSQ